MIAIYLTSPGIIMQPDVCNVMPTLCELDTLKEFSREGNCFLVLTKEDFDRKKNPSQQIQ